MVVRAKFKFVEKTEIRNSPSSPSNTKVVFRAEYDETIPEDRRFARATPNGTFEMWVDNSDALAQLELGRQYYLDLTPAE